jgi:hypothetical protein
MRREDRGAAEGVQRRTASWQFGISDAERKFATALRLAEAGFALQAPPSSAANPDTENFVSPGRWMGQVTKKLDTVLRSERWRRPTYPCMGKLRCHVIGVFFFAGYREGLGRFGLSTQ